MKDVSGIEIIGAQDETIIVEFSTEKLAGLGIDRNALIAALQAQNAVRPAGTVQTGDEKLALRVSGAFTSEVDILAVNIASRHIRRFAVFVPRLNSAPAQSFFDFDAASRSCWRILRTSRSISRQVSHST